MSEVRKVIDRVIESHKYETYGTCVCGIDVRGAEGNKAGQRKHLGEMLNNALTGTPVELPKQANEPFTAEFVLRNGRTITVKLSELILNQTASGRITHIEWYGVQGERLLAWLDPNEIVAVTR